MKRCAKCGGKFGLIRYTAFCLGYVAQFCSKKCSNRYFEDRRKAAQAEETRKQFLRWLNT